MEANTPGSQNQQFVTYARICGSCVFAIGLVVLIGWVFNIAIFRSLIPGWVEMKTNTSIGYMLAGVSLWCLADPKCKSNTKSLGKASAVFIIVLGLLTTLQYLFNISLGIDELLFIEPPGAVGTSHPNRMAIASAVNFVLKGIALLFINSKIGRNKITLSQGLSLFTAIAPMQAMIAYSYGVKNVLGEGQFYIVTQMAIHSALAWFLLSVGTLIARPDVGLLRPLTFERDLSKTWCTTLGIAIVVPPVFGFVFSLGSRNGLYDPGFGYSILAVTCVVIITSFIWLAATRTWRIRLRQLEAESKILTALRLRDEFLSIASHELKTPLTTLRLQAQSLQRVIDRGDLPTIPSSSIVKFINHTDTQTTRLNHLVEDMLDISRIDAGILVPHKQEVNFSALVKKTCDDFSQRLKKANCTLDCSIESDIHADLDSFRIVQVIENLLTNAMKYGPGKPVEMKLYKSGEKIILSLTDHGNGIDQEDQNRIFERFERAISSSEVSGLGLGLYIVRKILDSHDAVIKVESEKGAGATFVVELPSA